MTITIAVDAMGGDHGVLVTIPACIKFLSTHKDINLILVGDSKSITAKLGNNLKLYKNNIEIVHTTEVVEMDELPQTALRFKKNSSMRVAINYVKEKKANIIVSAGNTGALMATSRYVLRTMEGIERPAIAKLIPTLKNDVLVLDLGANTECTALQLFQFGILGTQLMRGITNKEDPSVGLLNIGSEEMKGLENIKKAADLFKQSDLNFYGNIEGNNINQGIVDVVVCDGFTGNVALKTIEGVAKMISHFIKTEFNKNILSKIIAIIAYPVLNQVKKRLDTRKYNGAILLGLNDLVIKSHGGTDSYGFYYALEQALHEVNAQTITVIQEYLKKNQNKLYNLDIKKELLEFDDLNML